MLIRQIRFLALATLVSCSVGFTWADEERPTTKTPLVKPDTLNSSEPTTRKPIKPKELNETVKKGLKYLVQQQHEDGGFGQGGGWRTSGEGRGGRVEGKEVKDPPDVGNTCMVALALIRAGNTPKQGPYSKQLVKAIEFIEKHVEASDKESLYVTPIRDTQLQSKIGSYVDTFLTAMVMSELKGQMGDPKSEERLFAALNKTIGKIESNQRADGTFANNSGWASVLSQGLCSKALGRASAKGVAVKVETINRDFRQSVAQLDTSKTAVGSSADGADRGSRGLGGSISPRIASLSLSTPGRADAGVDLYFYAANGARIQDAVNSNLTRKGRAEQTINSPVASESSKEAARAELKEVEEIEVANAAAGKQLVENLGNERFLRGFGNNGGEEFLSYMNISETLLVQGGEAWEKWDKQACETIAKIQNSDGSWSGHHCITGRTFCTSAALLTMMADRAPVPVVADHQPAGK